MEFSMTETEFLSIAERVLGQIEISLERAADTADVDIECSRSGNVLATIPKTHGGLYGKGIGN
jgi:frataxin-like iron-binding protein CyaY